MRRAALYGVGAAALGYLVYWSEVFTPGVSKQMSDRGVSFYSFSAKDAAGKTVSFDQFRDKVVLVTNVASQVHAFASLVVIC